MKMQKLQETLSTQGHNYQAKETHSHVAVLLASHTQQSARVELCGLCLERLPSGLAVGKQLAGRGCAGLPSRRHPGAIPAAGTRRSSWATPRDLASRIETKFFSFSCFLLTFI